MAVLLPFTITFANPTDATNAQDAMSAYVNLSSSVANAKLGLSQMIKDQTATNLANKTRAAAAALIQAQADLGNSMIIT